MIKRKWAKAYILLTFAGIILSFILPALVLKISDSRVLTGVSIIFCFALVIIGGIIKLVFCKCPNCGSLY